MTGLEIALIAFGATSLGLGVTKGVMEYQAAEDRAAATRAAAGRAAYADESNSAVRYQRALKFRAAQLAEAAASGMDIGGSPLVLTAETLAIASEESAQARRQAMVRSQLAENAAEDIEKAGKIGLVTGIAGGVVNAASIGLMAGAGTSSAADPFGSLGESTLAPSGNITSGIESQLQTIGAPNYNLGGF